MMSKYFETVNVQPTTTKTTFVAGGTFSWAPQHNRLAEAGAIEVANEKQTSVTRKTGDAEKRASKK
jgi:hypothetical protein